MEKKKDLYSHSMMRIKTLIKKQLPVRRIVQFCFLFTIILIGVQLMIFVDQLKSHTDHIIARPLGVDGFLPISSLMTLKYWLLTGDFPLIHPAGVLLFIWILFTGLFLKRGFYSWICPFGLLNEYDAFDHAR